MAEHRICYSIIITVIFTFFVVAHFYLTAVLLMVFILFPIITLIIALINKSKLEVSLKRENVLNTSLLKYKISIHNKSIFPVGMCIIKVVFKNKFLDKEEVKFIRCPIKIRDTLDIDLSTECYLCGAYECRIDKVYILDYLCIFKFKKCTSLVLNDIFLNMLPNCNCKTESEMYDAESDKYSSYKKGDDNTEIFEIREYVSGDDTRRIHWKLSAIQNRLMVKDYSMPVSSGLFILLNVGNNKEENSEVSTDVIIYSFISLAESLIRNGESFNVIYYNVEKKRMKQKNIKSTEDIYEVINNIVNYNYNEYIMEDININTGDNSVAYLIYMTSMANNDFTVLERVSNATVMYSSSQLNIVSQEENHRFVYINYDNVGQVFDNLFNEE